MEASVVFGLSSRPQLLGPLLLQQPHHHKLVQQKKRPEAGGDFDTDRSIFVFGLGYTAVELAKQLHKDGWSSSQTKSGGILISLVCLFRKICGTCRSAEKKGMLAQKHGLEVHIFDPSRDTGSLPQSGLEALYQATHLLSCVPPDADLYIDTVLKRHLPDIKNAAQQQGRIRWIGYLSSTGVYGDHQGGWVDESSNPEPVDRKGAARLEAERSWLQLGQTGASVQIFRLGGIYGPGRSVLDTIRKESKHVASTRQQQVRDARRFTSRIHVSDVCQVIAASISSPNPGRIYNVVDDDPTPRSEVAAFAKKLLKLEEAPQQQEQQQMSSRVAEKRVVNKRIKEELGVQLLYPCYKDGLTEIVDLESD